MENPATWGPAEHVVLRVLQETADEAEIGGLSIVRRITDALREAGLLTDTPK